MTELAAPLTIHPGYQFGRVCIQNTRVPADVVAECVYAGDSVEGTAFAYDLTRTDVLMACWWLVTSGQLQGSRSKKYRKWLAWSEHAHRILGGWETGYLCDPDEFVPVGVQ